MLTKYIDSAIQSIPGLKELGSELSGAIHRAVMDGGEPTRDLADLLHGTWLGHPLHPALTDIVVGAWSMSSLFDFASLLGDSEEAEWAADSLTGIGVVAAIPTALAGLADYSTVPQNATRTATLHAIFNDIGLTLYILSLWQRNRGNRGNGIFLSTLGYGTIMVGAWLGGHLSFDKKVGVNHADKPSEPTEWTAVLDAAELRESKASRVEVEGQPVLLYRYGGTVYATGALCPHAGGPLDEGTFDGHCVQCPWHDSVFDLRDGGVVHGPSTYPLPKYQARIHDGSIEIRVAGAQGGGQSGSSHSDHSHSSNGHGKS